MLAFSLSVLLLVSSLVSQVEDVGSHLVARVHLVTASVADGRPSTHIYLPTNVQIIGRGLSLHGNLRMLLNHEEISRVWSMSPILVHALGLEEGLILLHFLLHQVLHDARVVLQAVVAQRLV